MSLEGFKSIFWLEYLHRLVGRVLAFILLIPTILSFLRPTLRCYLGHIAAIWTLGAAQAAAGWIMVKSGLKDIPWVNPSRLTIHLLLAVALITSITILIIKLSPPAPPTVLPAKIRWRFYILSGFIIATTTMGGIVAGLGAGHIYNSFPLMDGQLIPSDAFFIRPLWKDIVSNPPTVQFLHRILAFITWVTSLDIWWQTNYHSAPKLTRKFGHVILTAASLQVALGAITVLYSVPILAAVTHQLWAIIFFNLTLWIAWRYCIFTA